MTYSQKHRGPLDSIALILKLVVLKNSLKACSGSTMQVQGPKASGHRLLLSQATGSELDGKQSSQDTC